MCYSIKYKYYEKTFRICRKICFGKLATYFTDLSRLKCWQMAQKLIKKN